MRSVGNADRRLSPLWSLFRLLAPCVVFIAVCTGCEGTGDGLVLSSIVDGDVTGDGDGLVSSDPSATPEPLPDPFPSRARSSAILAHEVAFDLLLSQPSSDAPSLVYRDYLLALASTGKSADYYNLQIPLDGIVSMFEATGRRDHFELALEICERMVAAANQDRDGDGHPEWDGTTFDGTPPSDGRPDLLLYDLQGSVAIARLARIVVTSATLEPTYGTRARALASFVEVHIIDKWLIDQHNLIYFRALPNWHDKASMTVRILVELYRITGDPARRDVAEELANQFVANVLDYDAADDCYTWMQVNGMDTSHTNREAVFIDTCASEGIVFTDQDVVRVSNTVERRIWNGDWVDTRCNNRHDGANPPMMNRGPWEWGQIFDGWIRTGRVNPTVQNIGERILELAYIYPPLNPTVAWSRHESAKLPFHGHLARNLWLTGQ